MEDDHICCTMADGNSVYAVLDGHGGTEISQWCGLHFCEMLEKNEAYKAGDYKKALHDVNFEIDKELEEDATVEELWELREHNNDG